MWFVYILLCDQKTYYVGLTSNITKRLDSHILKHNIATKEFSDIKLVYKERYKIRKGAEERETQLKKWTRAKKKVLIEGNMDLLRELGRSGGC